MTATYDPVTIHVVDTSIRALLLSGTDFVNVHTARVSFADFTETHTDGSHTVHGSGLYVSAIVQGGPHNGERIVAPLRAVNGFRVTP